MKYYTLNITRTLLREGETAYPANNPKAATEYALEYCFNKNDLWREHAYLIFVNNKYYIEGHYHLATGGTDSVIMDKRVACIAMLGANASGAILVHNHPSGDPRPSQSDIKETGEIKKAFGAIGCKLLDHIIIGDDSIFSFSEEGTIKINQKL